MAEDTIADVEASGLWPGKVVTEVSPAGDFWEAEPEHQDYLQKYPDGYTCHFVRLGCAPAPGEQRHEGDVGKSKSMAWDSVPHRCRTSSRYDVDFRFAFMWAPFLVRPSKDGVALTDDRRLVATFGILKLHMPLDNVTGAHITRGYRWWTAVGARGSFVDDGSTFGTTERRSVRSFRDRAASPLRRKGHWR